MQSGLSHHLQRRSVLFLSVGFVVVILLLFLVLFLLSCLVLFSYIMVANSPMWLCVAPLMKSAAAKLAGRLAAATTSWQIWLPGRRGVGFSRKCARANTPECRIKHHGSGNHWHQRFWVRPRQ